MEKRILWKLQCTEVEIIDAGTFLECRTVGHEIRICVLQSMPHVSTAKMPHPNQHHNDTTSEVFSDPINCPCVSRIYPNIFCIVPCWQISEGTPSSVLFERIRVRVRSQQRLASPLDIIPFLGPGGKRSWGALEISRGNRLWGLGIDWNMSRIFCHMKTKLPSFFQLTSVAFGSTVVATIEVVG